MFGTAIRLIGRKPKPKMKPIELKTPPEQTQTITRAIFDIVKEHGPLTISETWDHVQVIRLPFGSLVTVLSSISFLYPELSLYLSLMWVMLMNCLTKSLIEILLGSWFKRTDEQEAHEDSVEVDEGEAEAQTNMQPCRT